MTRSRRKATEAGGRDAGAEDTPRDPLRVCAGPEQGSEGSRGTDRSRRRRAPPESRLEVVSDAVEVSCGTRAGRGRAERVTAGYRQVCAGLSRDDGLW